MEAKWNGVVFDYIRDYLGYRIELQTVDAPKTLAVGGTNPVEITLITADSLRSSMSILYIWCWSMRKGLSPMKS